MAKKYNLDLSFLQKNYKNRAEKQEKNISKVSL